MPTLYEKLIAAGLPIASATESGEIIGLPDTTMTREQEQTFNDILTEHFQPARWIEILAERADLQAIKDNYIASITRLQQIQNAGAIPFTQAGFNLVVQATKDMAQIQERTLKFLKRLLT